MSVLVSASTTNHHHHHHHHRHHHSHSPYFSNNLNRRSNGTVPQNQQNRLTTTTSTEHEQETDHVPFGVVSSMKQRLLDKVNESLVLNNSSSLLRNSLLKSSSRISSNENLLQTKPSVSSLKGTTRLSRSQDNLTNNNNSLNLTSVPPTISTEQFNSYIQPKQDVIIVDTTTNKNHRDSSYDDDEKLRAGQKTLPHRQSYTELHVDEAPKPGTVTTVKNMFERQIRLSRYDADKLINTSTPSGSRMGSQHRDMSSPTRSRSISPNDMALRQRRTSIPTSSLPVPSTTLSLPVSTPYPDVVISHTPPAETNKSSHEQTHTENLSLNNPGINKEKKLSSTNRSTTSYENTPLSVTVDESSTNTLSNNRPNLLLPSKLVSENVDCQPLDFKSRLALFNRTNTTQKPNENTLNIKKNFHATNSLTKPVVHQPPRVVNEEKKDVQTEIIPNPFSIPISRSVVNIAKAVTFFGGNKLNGTNKSSLPDSIAPPLPSEVNYIAEQTPPIDSLQAPDVIGGDVKLSKSSIFSGVKKNIRVQFTDDVDTFEYPSFEVIMAEHGGNDSDDDNAMDVDNDSPTKLNNNGDHSNNMMKNHMIGKKYDKEDELINNNNNQIDDVDDDELERLARINAEFNTNNLSEKPLKPKGTLHTFRPTHLDQYELGTQHGSLTIPNLSDISSPTNSYSMLARQKLLSSADISSKNISNHPILKQQKLPFDMTNNIQWSSMSTTTDLLF